MDEDKLTLARIQQLLEENLELSRETQQMVLSLRRNARLAFWTRLVLWALVLILPLLLLPTLLNTIFPTGDSSSPGINLFGLPSQQSLEKAIDSYRGTAQ